MTRTSDHVEWLNLIDRSGPFVAPAVLEEVFPQGFEKVETPRAQRLRIAYDEWRDAVDEGDPDLADLHAAWVRMVLRDALEYEDEVLASRAEADDAITYRAPEHGACVVPDFVVRGDDGAPRLLIAVHPPDTDLEKSPPRDRWPASPAERMALLCRANGVRVGLVTNGEQWLLVNAPVGGTSGYVSWFARLWWQEPVTLRAFVSLLGVRRCFGPPDETLDQLLERSLSFQEEVTDTLGEQVRRAVEVLIQALGRADEDRNGELLEDVSPAELYEAGLTVMMRLVFILCAEERGLLLLGDPIYDQHYAISTLRARLREDESQHGSEVLERRYDAWCRILAVFRAVYGGIEHEALRMPALGGSLFDPDRFPFLEGRAKGTSWREVPASPLPIDNRTVLLLLTALQVLEQRGGAQLLSYRALDIEQIGHVYEGLLEYTVVRVPEVMLGLKGSQRVRHPTITLSALEALRAHGIEKAAARLADLTGRSLTAIRNGLERAGDRADMRELIQACAGDEGLAERITPFAELIRSDASGSPLVYPAGSFAITLGAARRDTGTHYTPRSLAETIVEKTLEPLVYTGPSEGTPREEWKLKSPAELLDLKVCDPAMGSGAFLVQACRYLAERLVESWSREDESGRVVTADGLVCDSLDGTEPLPKDPDERLIIARRLIAERCLYGVDVNPLAVELAKLSIWLVTLAKGRPFGFLDHNLRCGDSLLGIHRLAQLIDLDMDPGSEPLQRRLFGQSIEAAVTDAVELRTRLREVPIRDVRDVDAMARLDAESRRIVETPLLVADAFVGEVLRSPSNNKAIDASLDALAMEADRLVDGDTAAREAIRSRATEALAVDRRSEKPMRRPFHWPLEFPEVFARENPGFDAIIGNPPFLGGLKISGAHGADYRRWLEAAFHPFEGTADLCAAFFRRAHALLRDGGRAGLIATNTIGQGDTRRAGLAEIVKAGGAIAFVQRFAKWPGTANVEVNLVVFEKGGARRGMTPLLDGRRVATISSRLETGPETEALPLAANSNKCFQGDIVRGLGFVLEPEEAASLIASDARNADCLFAYLNGEDLNSDPEQKPSRWVICFHDWPLERVRQYPDLLRIVEERVKPEREKLRGPGDRRNREYWWQFGAYRAGMRRAIAPLRRVLVRSRVSELHALAFVQKGFVYGDATVVFAYDDDYHFALLQSYLHEVWARRYASTMRTDVRYTPTDCFATFPFPVEEYMARDLADLLADPRFRAACRLGEEYHEHRRQVMRSRGLGLTKTYNLVHDPACEDEDIVRLRGLHAAIDRAALACYGWDDLDLGHGFHQNERGQTRYTIAPQACDELVRRLMRLNAELGSADQRSGPVQAPRRGRRA